jgi:hypothetical protein
VAEWRHSKSQLRETKHLAVTTHHDIRPALNTTVTSNTTSHQAISKQVEYDRQIIGGERKVV